MVTSQEALEIARIYAEQNGRGWDERYFEVNETIIDGEPLWMVSTSDVAYAENLPWMMTHMPGPSYYYVSMLKAKCVAVGTRLHEFYKTE